jgi:hypothetical protein
MSALAETTGVPYQTLSRWKREGTDIFSPPALAERMERTKQAPAESITSARLKKLNLESDRLRLQVDSERGKLVDAGLVYSDARSIGSQVRQRLTKAASNDLPPLLAGRSASEVKVLLTKYFRDLCAELSHTQHPITTNLKS